VEDGRVLVNVGGGDGAGIVAFNAETGAVLWTATNHEASYSSPVSATFGGRDVALFFTRQGLIGLEPATGKTLFQRAWRSRSQASVNAATPLVVGDLVFVSASYETGAAVLRVPAPISRTCGRRTNRSNHATSACRRLLGFHGRQEFSPSFRCVALKTGKVQWSVDRFHAGTVTLAGDRLLIMRETGELLLAAATPDAFKPIAKAQILPQTVRAYPALADGFLFVRNDDTLVCLDLRP
jgi:hypothetical protein